MVPAINGTLSAISQRSSEILHDTHFSRDWMTLVQHNTPGVFPANGILPSSQDNVILYSMMQCTVNTCATIIDRRTGTAMNTCGSDTIG
jgi:hypothetical protein